MYSKAAAFGRLQSTDKIHRYLPEAISITTCFIDQPFPGGFSETFTAELMSSKKMLLFLNRYVAFDFHKECSRMRWDRLQILMDQLAEQQDEFR